MSKSDNNIWAHWPLAQSQMSCLAIVLLRGLRNYRDLLSEVIVLTGRV